MNDVREQRCFSTSIQSSKSLYNTKTHAAQHWRADKTLKQIQYSRVPVLVSSCKEKRNPVCPELIRHEKQVCDFKDVDSNFWISVTMFEYW